MINDIAPFLEMELKTYKDALKGKNSRGIRLSAATRKILLDPETLIELTTRAQQNGEAPELVQEAKTQLATASRGKRHPR